MSNIDTHLDAKTSGEIFRKDHPMILASNRHLATLLAVRLDFDAGTPIYAAGTVLGLNTVSGNYARYDNAGASGLDVAKAILFEDAEPADVNSTQLARGIFGGEVFEDKLTGLDAAAKVDLGSRTLEPTVGDKVLKF